MPLATALRQRRHSLRRVFDAIFYLLRTGCPWRFLPADFPPWQAVYYYFRRFRHDGLWAGILTALRQAERVRVGRHPQPSAAVMDAQSIKPVEESACISGYDGHKRVKGRKRHLLVDTLGLPISISVTSAGMHDKVGAYRLLAGLKPLVPRLEKIWADSVQAVFTGVAHGRPYAVIGLGLLVLIATPVVRVAATLVGFIRAKDPPYIAITAIVLTVLLLSFALGKAG